MNSVKFIFYGVVAAFGALAAEMVLSIFFPGDAAVLSGQITVLLLLAVIVEESLKFSLIFRSVSASSFLMPSFLVSLGFAVTEILLAYLKNASVEPNGFYLMLGGVGIIHLATGIICGYAAFSYKRNNRLVPPLLMFFLAVILHFIYNVAIIKLIKN